LTANRCKRKQQCGSEAIQGFASCGLKAKVSNHKGNAMKTHSAVYIPILKSMPAVFGHDQKLPRVPKSALFGEHMPV
jgi:hypothetical protein